MTPRFVFEIARNKKEAEELSKDGFGYEIRAAAEEALASPVIDSYYRNKLKVFRVKL